MRPPDGRTQGIAPERAGVAGMNLTAERVVEITGGALLHSAERVFNSYTIDSRKAAPGALFFAMKGAVTDGHLFVADAFQRGASGAVVEHEVEIAAGKSATQIQVAD